MWITIATLNFPIFMSYITGRIVCHMSHKISPDRGWFYIPITWSNNSFIIDKPIILVFFWLSIKSSWSRFNLCFSNIFPYISEDLDWKLHNLSTPGCLYIYTYTHIDIHTYPIKCIIYVYIIISHPIKHTPLNLMLHD